MNLEHRIRQLELKQPNNGIENTIKHLRSFNKISLKKPETELLKIARLNGSNVIKAIMSLYDIDQYTT